MSAATRLGGALLLGFLILTVWVYGPAPGLHLLNHWVANVSRFGARHNPYHVTHCACPDAQ
jgi:hypothetical protein